MNPEAMWSSRYRDIGDQYLVGTEPGYFLANKADLFKKGASAILLADGEGGNSVWLAEKGLDVTAIDITNLSEQI